MIDTQEQALAEANPYLHIKRPINPRFVARVRPFGGHKYIVIGKYKTAEKAAKAMIVRFMGNNNLKRGDVLVCEEWYEPNQILEITR